MSLPSATTWRLSRGIQTNPSGELRERYMSDDRLLVPKLIFNSILGRTEAI
jgi:hypothetical protein